MSLMFENEYLLNSKAPVKRSVLGVTLGQIKAYRKNPSKPKLSAIPGPYGGYIIDASDRIVKNHEEWCRNWRKSMGY